MFKRGGSSYEAQGTGITSPYDAPRKRYADGITQEEINERRRNLFQPRSEMDFAAEGFSALGNPYNQRTGEAKTIGEMLYEGATSVRKSRAADKALGQSVDLANIQSDENRLLAEEKHARDLELKQVAQNQLNKDYSIKRQVLDLTKILNKQAENAAFEGAEFINDGFGQAVAQGTVEINEGGHHAMVVPFSAIKRVNGVWDIDLATLAPGMVYWNPINQQWLIVENARTKDAQEIYYGSYQEAKAGITALTVKKDEKKSTSSDSNASDKEITTNEIKTKILTNLKDVELTDVVVNDEAQKIGIKIVEKPEGSGPNWKINLADNEMSLVDFKAILKTKKFSDQTQHLRTNKKKKNTFDFEEIETTDVAENLAAGGRAGYALGNVVNQGEELDPATDDLNELTSWWKSEVNKSFNS
jgi:hypothetical protein